MQYCSYEFENIAIVQLGSAAEPRTNPISPLRENEILKLRLPDRR